MIKCTLQEMSLKERTLIWRALKLLFILFNNLDIYRCTSQVMELQLKYFVFLKDNAFKYLKNQSLFWQFQVNFHI